MIKDIEKFNERLTVHFSSGDTIVLGNAVKFDQVSDKRNSIPFEKEAIELFSIRKSAKELSESLQPHALVNDFECPPVTMHTCWGAITLPMGFVKYEDADKFQNNCSELEWYYIEDLVSESNEEVIADEIKAINENKLHLLYFDDWESSEEWEAGQL